MEFIEKSLNVSLSAPSIKVVQNGAQSSILQTGYLSESFPLERGCRQGDPILPYMLILCMEILGKMVRHGKKKKKKKN